MSSENSRNRADYQSTLPDSKALEAHADSLIEDLFTDIDNILEDGSKFPSKPDYPALKPPSVPQVTLPPGVSATNRHQNIGSLPPAGSATSGLPPLGYSQPPSPQDRLGAGRYEAPTAIPASQDASPNDPQLDELSPGEAEPEIPNPVAEEPITGERAEIPKPTSSKPPTMLDKLLLWGTIATFASLAVLFFTWLISQYRLNVLRTANTTNSQTAPVSQQEREFIDYMQRSLKAIDQKTTVIPVQPVPQVPSSSIPVLTPTLPSLPQPSVAPQSVPIPVPEPAAPNRR